MTGKGSRRRKENYTSYTSNYDDIDWKRWSSKTPQLTKEQLDELDAVVKKAFKQKQQTKHAS